MRTKTKIVVSATVLGLAVLAVGVRAYAEGGLTLEERVQRLERRAEMPPPAAAPAPSNLQERLDALEAAIKKPPFGLTIGGMIVGSYLYDLNDPQDGNANTVGLRGFDRDHNTFSLDLFQLQVSRAPGENGVGFVTKVNFGKTAERMAADWDGDGSIGNVAEEQNSIELEEAYITYNFPGAPDLQLKGGKFVTLLGAEVIESPLNPNISRSLAFSFAIPFTHTGLLASYAISPVVKVTGGVVNGWDNVIDSNDGKSFLGSVAITPADQFSLALNGIYGAEQPNRGDSKRGVADVVATITPVENVSLILNYDYGNETDLGPGNGTTVEWHAFSGIAAVDLPDTFVVPVGFALRGEYFDDSDSTRLGGTFGEDQQDWEVTTTFKVVLAEGLMARAEYRYDNARRPVFLRNVGGTQDDQHTVAGELSYVF
jgi:Putative beta-barrel porin-2, OmpL-like. bbp2